MLPLLKYAIYSGRHRRSDEFGTAAYKAKAFWQPGLLLLQFVKRECIWTWSRLRRTAASRITRDKKL